MRKTVARSLLVLAGLPLLWQFTELLHAQQVADSTFSTKVDHPSYLASHPKVLFDEAHQNFHTASGRYKPFADLIISDGYRVTPNREKFTSEILEGYHILVIANALGAESMKSPEWSRGWLTGGSKPAFSVEECDAVHDWVQRGGSLLLIADHRPFGGAADALARRFGVEMSKGYAWDNENSPKEFNNPGVIVYTWENGQLVDHPITQGRDTTERINRIVTFVGQSLEGPKSSAAFLKLAGTAIDRENLQDSAKIVSAAGRSQGLALEHNKGRVIVFGEAAMLSAQVGGKEKFGMNYPGVDNKQLALNVMHWLSRLLN